MLRNILLILLLVLLSTRWSLNVTIPTENGTPISLDGSPALGVLSEPPASSHLRGRKFVR